MKKLIAILIFQVMVFDSVVVGQNWTQQISGVDSSLLDVYFINEHTGYVSGKNGIILKTVDGGSVWQAQNSGVTDGLACIQFVSENIGYASGGFTGGDAMNCRLLKTINGGITWSNIDVAPSKCGGGIWFLNAETGFYAYADSLYHSSVIAKTTDGGANWNIVHTGEGWISYFYFVDADHGFATVNNGTILKTINGGQSWTTLNLPGDLWGSGIHFFNQNKGIVGGGPPNAPVSMYKTVNAGTDWTTVSSSPSMIFKIFFADENNGYALTVDVTGAGSMIKSTNSGDSWTTETTPLNNLRGLYFVNNNLGFAVGDDGVILKYENTTAVNKLPVENEAVIIYPNPAMSTISIDYKGHQPGKPTVNIYSISGKRVLSEIPYTNNQTINIGELNNGVYFVEIKYANTIANQKLIIQR